MSNTSLRDLSLTQFAGRLAEKTPTPGGGSVAAHLAQVGAALGCMAFRFTSGEKFAAVEAAMTARAAELETIRARAAELIDADAAAYDLVTSAYRLPKASEAEKTARSAAIQAGMRQAIAVPAETLDLALRALRLVADGAPAINPNLVSDCASGVWCLWSAAEAAFLNVRINVGSLADKEAGRARLAACERDLAQARALAESARAAIEHKLG